MQAVFVNCVAVIIGSIIGLLCMRKISETVSDVISGAAGIVTLIIGFSMAFSTCNIVYLTLSVIIGGLIGTKCGIEDKIQSFGDWVAGLLAKSTKKMHQENNDSAKLKPKTSFGYAFLNASVLFCVGAMAVIGSFQAGIEGDYTIIYTKSILDGFLSIVFAASLGAGTILSSLTIFVYQGALTLLSSLLRPFVTETMLNSLSAVGGALIIMIGLSLLKLKNMKTANYLPALIVIAIFILCEPLLKQCTVLITNLL